MKSVDDLNIYCLIIVTNTNTSNINNAIFTLVDQVLDFGLVLLVPFQLVSLMLLLRSKFQVLIQLFPFYFIIKFEKKNRIQFKKCTAISRLSDNSTMHGHHPLILLCSKREIYFFLSALSDIRSGN
jgi:hypothetical protein